MVPIVFGPLPAWVNGFSPIESGVPPKLNVLFHHQRMRAEAPINFRPGMESRGDQSDVSTTMIYTHVLQQGG